MDASQISCAETSVSIPRPEGIPVRGSSLLEEILDAHGGQDRFARFRRAQGEFEIEGDIWSTRGGPPGLVGGRFELKLVEQSVELHCSTPRRIESTFTPTILAIAACDGGFVETQYNPRSSFAERGPDMPWDDFQLAYISSYSIWNVVTQPFIFGMNGFSVSELPPTIVGKETLRRAEVSFPSHVASHAPKIVCNIAPDGTMRWQDFRFDLMDAPVTSVLRDFQSIQGIEFATRRTMYRTTELEKPDPVIFAEIRIGNLTFY